MKTALQLASKASMIDQFCMSNICILQSLGYKVNVAADFSNPGSITNDRSRYLKDKLFSMGVDVFDIPIPKSLNPQALYNAYKEINLLFKNNHFDLVHCHSPIGAALCRIVAKKERKNGTAVIYTAHGFHFYDGAPLINWLLYYPVEKTLSKYTDVLVTINTEDYQRAKKAFHAKNTIYIPGIGVNTSVFYPEAGDRERIRAEIGIDGSKIVLLSVGELNNNKNHEKVIQAIQGKGYVYIIVGQGVLKQRLEQLARECDVELHLMGYRSDVVDFYAAADVYVLPSIREGLNVSLMEAMACGLPVACSSIRGNTDLIDEPLFNPKSAEEIYNAVLYALNNRMLLGRRNSEMVRAFSQEKVNQSVLSLYEGLTYDN